MVYDFFHLLINSCLDRYVRKFIMYMRMVIMQLVMKVDNAYHTMHEFHTNIHRPTLLIIGAS